MIELSDVCIQQGEFALESISCSVDTGEYAVFMGPTGCGKTTMLELICGLRRLGSGSIKIQGREISKLPASRRDIGYVPQDRALFPTMRVDQQIEFGLVARRASSGYRRERVRELAELLGIDHLLSRYPVGLSGGECQRVALARALSFRPRLMCLDEPLSALDDKTRGQMAELLQKIHVEEHVTVLHITHNAEDAKRLGTIHFRFQGRQLVRIDSEKRDFNK